MLWLPLTLALSLLLIQPIKGMVIAMQWRVGMHGFRGGEEAARGGTVRTGVISVRNAVGEHDFRNRCPLFGIML